VFKSIKFIVLLILITHLSACTTTPRPRRLDNICAVFRQYPKWYWAAQNTQRRWGVPVSVQMAIIHQESRFTANAKPARRKLLWIIPWTRLSSSYGYTQALKMTWENYKKSTGRYGGIGGASRDNFADATDFIGWYVDTAHRKLGIPRNDAYKLYLSYHEGLGGYARKTYLRKTWLIHVARKVKARAATYRAQLYRCHASLKKKPWFRFW